MGTNPHCPICSAGPADVGMYSEVPNKSVTFLILFWDFFLPIWPFKDLYVYLFLGKVPTYTVFYVIIIKKFSPTSPNIKTYTFTNF